MSCYSLFDDPALKKLKESLSKEDQEKYKKSGEYMYASLPNDGEEKKVSMLSPDGKVYDDAMSNNISEEVLEQLTIAIRSGLHPSDLTKEEREFLENYHPLQKNWFKDFGFLENDLNRINL